jgi:hypothetical protein
VSVGSVLRTAAVPAVLAVVAAVPLLARAAADAQPSPSPSPASRKATPRPSASAPARTAATPQPTVTIRPTSPRPGSSPHVYSNRDLPEQPSPEPEKDGKKGEKKAEKATPAPTASPTPDAAAAAFEAERQRQAAEEASWRGRAAAARDAVATNEAAVAKLQDEAGRLANRILLSTDTNEILRLRAEQQKVQASLDAARNELEASRKAVDDLQEEARRAGVPPGWVRED